jgi:hypothetical protein
MQNGIDAALADACKACALRLQSDESLLADMETVISVHVHHANDVWDEAALAALEHEIEHEIDRSSDAANRSAVCVRSPAGDETLAPGGSLTIESKHTR